MFLFCFLKIHLGSRFLENEVSDDLNKNYIIFFYKFETVDHIPTKFEMTVNQVYQKCLDTPEVYLLEMICQ